MSALLRSQRRLAGGVFAAVVVLLGGIALIGTFWPGFGAARLLGLPVAWLVLGALIYPVLIAIAVYTVRHCERNERAFTELVRRRDER